MWLVTNLELNQCYILSDWEVGHFVSTQSNRRKLKKQDQMSIDAIGLALRCWSYVGSLLVFCSLVFVGCLLVFCCSFVGFLLIFSWSSVGLIKKSSILISFRLLITCTHTSVYWALFPWNLFTELVNPLSCFSLFQM